MEKKVCVISAIQVFVKLKIGLASLAEIFVSFIYLIFVYVFLIHSIDRKLVLVLFKPILNYIPTDTIGKITKEINIEEVSLRISSFEVTLPVSKLEVHGSKLAGSIVPEIYKNPPLFPQTHHFFNFYMKTGVEKVE